MQLLKSGCRITTLIPLDVVMETNMLVNVVVMSKFLGSFISFYMLSVSPEVGKDAVEQLRGRHQHTSIQMRSELLLFLC